MPRSTFAATIQPQLGAQIIMNGTGRPSSQPSTRMRLRPYRSASTPDTRFKHALTTPKLMMKLTTVVFSRRPNSRVPIKGTTVRSSPTMPPTQALISIKRANCAALARIPSRSGVEAPVVAVLDRTLGNGTAVRSGFEFNRSIGECPCFIQSNDTRVVWGCRGNAGQYVSDEHRLGQLQPWDGSPNVRQGSCQRLAIKGNRGARMAGQDQRILRQCEEPLQAVVEQLRPHLGFLRARFKIWATD